MRYYTKSDVELFSNFSYNYSKIEGQNYEEKKYNDINAITISYIL